MQCYEILAIRIVFTERIQGAHLISCEPGRNHKTTSCAVASPQDGSRISQGYRQALQIKHCGTCHVKIQPTHSGRHSGVLRPAHTGLPGLMVKYSETWQAGCSVISHGKPSTVGGISWPKSAEAPHQGAPPPRAGRPEPTP